MDSVTQALLGASVGAVVAGRGRSRRGALYGAALGTLPDLDVVIDYASAIDDFTRHRGFSHSWLVQTALAAPTAWLIHRLDPGLGRLRWLALVWLVWVTHSALDTLTVYGTQLFWPLSTPPVMSGSVFIIDPLYSLPLAIALLWCLAAPGGGRRAATLALGLSTAYLGWGLAAQQMVDRRLAAELESRGIADATRLVVAAPFTTLLWRVLAMDGDHYLQGYASVLDDDRGIDLTRHSRGAELLPAVADGDAFRRFDWFNHGFNAAERIGDTLVVRDLRMGSEPVYVFRFVLGEWTDDGFSEVLPRRLDRGAAPNGYFAHVWRRTFDRQADRWLRRMALDAASVAPVDACAGTGAANDGC